METVKRPHVFFRDSMSFFAQASFIYLAQCVLGLGIASGLRYFGKIYPRIHLNTWSLSAFLFCFHALLYSYLSSPGGPFFMRYLGSMLSAVSNNLHLVFLLIGCYEAINERTIRVKLMRSFVILAIVVGFVTTSIFVFDQQKFLESFFIRIGLVGLLTAGASITAGLLILTAKTLKGIGVTIVGCSFTLYGLTHAYNVSGIVRGFLDYDFTPLPIFGLLELLFIAMIGFGLFIWLLEDERERLQKANEQLDRFIYSTSHDLRAPIASILGLLTVARLELKDQKVPELMGMIEGRVLKLDQIIGDILSLSRVQKSELRYELIDFNSLMADSIADVKFIDGHNGIILRYAESAENRFHGDYNLTKTILGNLLSNAVKYHRPNRQDAYIEVLFEKKADRVSFVVADNGEGISQEHHEKIFDMFYRASTTNSQGTGLGLYIVKETLNRIRGKISMDSKEGVGTKFVVTLEQ